MIKSLYPQFQFWSIEGSVWIISDPHFDDPARVLYNWPSTDDYIKSIKPMIGVNDTLVCLGDVGNVKRMEEFNCYRVLVTGNHDAGATTYEKYFHEIYKGPLFIADRILLSHEPIFGLEEICVNIHGHVHCETNIYVNHINLAADNVNFKLFNLGQAIKNGLLSSTKNYHKLTLEKIKNL